MAEQYLKMEWKRTEGKAADGGGSSGRLDRSGDIVCAHRNGLGRGGAILFSFIYERRMLYE